MCEHVFLLGSWLMDTDQCLPPALCLSASFSADHRSGIYEARGLIHSQIMWAEHSWTALLSIFPTLTPPPPPEKETKTSFFFHLSTAVNCWVLSGPQITWKDRVEVFAQAAGLGHDIRLADKMFSQHAMLHACQRLLEGLVWSPSMKVTSTHYISVN